MSIVDKYNIIENHVCSDTKEQTISKVTNYFENLINSEYKVLSPDYISMSIWFQQIDHTILVDIINEHIKNYLIQHRNNIRSIIKRNSFELSGLNKFLKTFINKLEYINNNIKTANKNIIITGIKNLSNHIISDSFIIIFIENQLILLDQDLKKQISALINFCKYISKYDNMDTINKMIKIFGNIFKKQLVTFEENILPDNIKRIQKFVDTIKYCIKINDYFECTLFSFAKQPKFVGSADERTLETLCVSNLGERAEALSRTKETKEKLRTQLIQPILNSLFDSFIDIIKNNSLLEIKFVMENVWDSFNNLFFNTMVSENKKSEYTTTLSNEITCIVDKNKDMTLNNMIDIISIISVTEKFIVNKSHREIISMKIISYFESEQMVSNIHMYIDNMIRANNVNVVIALINNLYNLKNKDEFVQKYYQQLIKRIMETYIASNEKKMSFDDFTKYINIERNVLTVLKINFGAKLVYKIEKVINDSSKSYDDMYNYNKLIIDYFLDNMNVITTSYDNWDINTVEGIVDNKMLTSIKDSIIYKYIMNYDKYYSKRYNGMKILNWFPHFGEITITYLNQDYIMLPIHFMVMEMFENNNTMKYDDILSASFFRNYSKKFVNDIIGSLLTSKLFKVSKKSDVMYMILNEDVNNITEDRNLIQIFFNNSDYAEVWEQKRIEEFAFTRLESTNANINTILKVTGLNKEELFVQTKNRINIFELDMNQFEKSLEFLISKDYIKLNLNNNMYEKIFY